MISNNEDVSPNQIWYLAEKVGVKPQMINMIKYCLGINTDKSTKLIKQFGPEEIFYALHQGMTDAGVGDNFNFRSNFTLARAYLYGFLVGKYITKERGNRNVETSNKD
jgi:hypothetical protein